MPIIQELGPILADIFKNLTPVFAAVADIIVKHLFPAFKSTFEIVSNNIPTIATFVGVLGTLLLAFNAIRIATAAWAVVQGVLNAVMALNPLVLVAIAVAALVAGIVYLATKTTFFQDTWKKMTTAVTQAWQGFSNLFSSIGKGIANFFGTLVSNIAAGWDATVKGFGDGLNWFANLYKTVWSGIGNFFKGIINGYIGIWEGFINGIIGGVNLIIRALNGLQVTLPDWIPGLGGKTFGVNLPQVPTMRIPRLADGGIVMPTPGGVLANIAEAGKPEAVIPLDRMGDFGGKSQINITVNAGMGADGNQIGKKIVEEILRFERSSGPVFARA
jgi:phage-related protein